MVEGLRLSMESEAVEARFPVQREDHDQTASFPASASVSASCFHLLYPLQARTIVIAAL